MMGKFPENGQFDLSKINNDILERWNKEKTFEKSLENRKGKEAFIFYEGPPSANGKPGIHHVISRTIKDIFCRFKTMTGFYVERKAGWDTHGLPVELSVEKRLDITKEDIGTPRISIEDYNAACRKDVMQYTDVWEKLTKDMGYWINMEDPYVTYDNRYIETLWFLLKKLYDKALLYKGYSIQPYSPAAGTGLSTHELNQPGAYRDVKDTTCVAQFRVIRDEHSEFLFRNTDTDIHIMAWTTTPWTLPSNTALAVGANISYVRVRSFNPYSGNPITVVLAKDLVNIYFPEQNAELELEAYKPGDKHIPFKVLDEFRGKKLTEIRYEQLLPWVNPGKSAFRVISGDFVTTEEGTGIVHIAPTFGADDYRAGLANDIPPLTILDRLGSRQPLVDKKGRFYPMDEIQPEFAEKFINPDAYAPFAGRYVKNEYDDALPEGAESVDVDIAVHLKKEDKVFRIEKHVHNYPHCWRTDKPVLYYPLDSWFIKTTAMKERMIELNNTINWKPEATGFGRFGKWLENLVDWNLSRSRFWGTPLPIWVSEDRKEQVCIGSVVELKKEIEKSVNAGFMKENPLVAYREGDVSTENYEHFDLHRPFVDNIILASPNGKKMYREPGLIDVWFDSGAMPYAQVHYPFSINDKDFKQVYPADFIAEGVDQTRGWFFTLHALAVMLFDSVAYKNIISNGLVLDKNGNKMSKRLGNAVDPFQVIHKHGSDPLRWYLMTNAQPWDNLKFDESGLEEVKRKFFGTLFNTYSFFALYANIDGFSPEKEEIPVSERPEIDRWILSLLHSLIKDVRMYYEDYEPTRAARRIQEFVIDNLSNWYVRLNRKRYWGGEQSKDKTAAYQTLYTCLETVAMLMAPVAPFYADKLYTDLHQTIVPENPLSVHLSDFPVHDLSVIDTSLEERMAIAQKVSSMVLGLRRKVNIKVRQPLSKIMVPVLDDTFEAKVEAVRNLILSEVNVKEVEYLKESSDILVKKIKPDFKILGPKYGKQMKAIATAVTAMSQEDIQSLEKNGRFELKVPGETLILSIEEVEIFSEDIPGWLVASDGPLTVALDITVTPELREEGIARELINRIQNIRKESGFNVTDKIDVSIEKDDQINHAISEYKTYISEQTLIREMNLVERIEKGKIHKVDLDDEIKINMAVEKVSNR